MSGHVMDRFVRAAWPDFPNAEPLPEGMFMASPEAARMLVEHCRRFPNVAGDGTSIFGRPVLLDPTLPRGSVVWSPVKRKGEG